VAIGRAIVRNPKIFLFDEPLSNLDAELRVSMRSELRELHGRLKSTMIYVTHDQVEAMTMADRIVVLKDGRITEMGTHAELMESSGIYQQMVLVQTAPPTMPTAPGAPGSGAAHSHGGAASRPSGHATPAAS
jgi:ABC-type sugar transport system ATPase subunit